jgi:hypothetical protein
MLFTSTPKRNPAALSAGYSLWNYRYNLFVAALAFELDDSIDCSKERVILSLTDIEARHDFGTALADYDRTGMNKLSAVGFDAQSLTVGIPAVS